jgi:hypothetical protein
MDERCIGCPWFDKERYECTRKPPRFCEVDLSIPPLKSRVKETAAVGSGAATSEDR